MLELGASFKKARESRNISIDTIAVETRISTRFLRAIENEEFEVLPGGIFNRGFIRTYAGRLGLDPDEAIRTYEKLSRTSELEPVRHETERVTGQTTKIPVYYVAIAGLLILVAIFYFATRHSEPSQATPGPPAADAAVTKPGSVPTREPAATVPEPEPSLGVAAAVPVSAPAPVPAPVPPQPAAVPNAPVVVELDVREETWLKLSSDGTAIVSGEVLPAGTMRRYTANNSIDVSIGNAAGVLLRVNGQPVSTLGRSGQVRSMTITPKTTAVSLASKY